MDIQSDSLKRLLEAHNFHQYVDSFEKEGITLPLLTDIKDSHLKDIGMSIGERIKLKRIINHYQRRKNRIVLIRNFVLKYDNSNLVLDHNLLDHDYHRSEVSTKCLLIGHRGASGYEPENTLLSFTKAIEMGVHGVELDVHLCRTGELVVIHDDKLDRTTNGKGKVCEKSLEELRTLDAGKGEKIPTLAEVLDLVFDNDIIINIELKGYGTMVPTVNLLKEYFSKGFSHSKIVITSFIHQYVKEFRSMLPVVSTGLLIRSELLGFAALAEAADADFLVTHYEYANENVIEDAHSRGVKVMTYTVNSKKKIKKLRDMGIDGIITNFPDRFFD
jgi:glycerophosphoryl diester phosphodiesterase